MYPREMQAKVVRGWNPLAKICMFVILMLNEWISECKLLVMPISCRVRLHFQQAWNTSLKAQHLTWSHSFTAQNSSTKTLFQTKSWALKLCFKVSWKCILFHASSCSLQRCSGIWCTFRWFGHYLNFCKNKSHQSSSEINHDDKSFIDDQSIINHEDKSFIKTLGCVYEKIVNSLISRLWERETSQ